MSRFLIGMLTEQLIPTRLPPDGKVSQPHLVALEYTFADATADIPLPASAAEPCYVLGIKNLIIEAFTGGTPTVNVGDGSTVDKYLAAGALAEDTVGNLVDSVVGAYLVANGKIRVTIGASNTTGKGVLFVTIFRPGSAAYNALHGAA